MHLKQWDCSDNCGSKIEDVCGKNHGGNSVNEELALSILFLGSTSRMYLLVSFRNFGGFYLFQNKLCKYSEKYVNIIELTFFAAIYNWYWTCGSYLDPGKNQYVSTTQLSVFLCIYKCCF